MIRVGLAWSIVQHKRCCPILYENPTGITIPPLSGSDHGMERCQYIKKKASVDNEEVSVGSSSKERVEKMTIMLPDESRTTEDICEKNKVSSKNSTMAKCTYKNILRTAGINQVKEWLLERAVIILI